MLDIYIYLFLNLSPPLSLSHSLSNKAFSSFTHIWKFGKIGKILELVRSVMMMKTRMIGRGGRMMWRRRRSITTYGYPRKITKSVVIPHSLERVESVVVDIENFPTFLPFCHESVVIEDSMKSDEIQNVERFDCVLGFRHLNIEEQIKHHVRREKSSNRVLATAVESTHFYSIQYDWRFNRIEDNISKASLDLYLDLKSLVHAMTFDMMKDAIEMKVFEAFMKRVDEVSKK
tara:strand:+ start:2398 stop:3090 length:693 start_codon:yes stop_codon:yes gene_type:complete